jgi:hypothetical protein
MFTSLETKSLEFKLSIWMSKPLSKLQSSTSSESEPSSELSSSELSLSLHWKLSICVWLRISVRAISTPSLKRLPAFCNLYLYHSTLWFLLASWYAFSPSYGRPNVSFDVNHLCVAQGSDSYEQCLSSHPLHWGLFFFLCVSRFCGRHTSVRKHQNWNTREQWAVREIWWCLISYT